MSALMAPSLVHQQGFDERVESRTSIFVLAMVHFADGSTPVKIRDMSRRGALIEAPIIPPVGTDIRLCRGGLTLPGKVVWAKEARAGLLFEGFASVSDWLPRKTPPGQQLADQLFQHKRETASVSVTKAATPAIVRSAAVTASDLVDLRRAIEALAEDLADDPAVLAVHGHKLQTLDLATQILGRLARQLVTGPRPA